MVWPSPRGDPRTFAKELERSNLLRLLGSSSATCLELLYAARRVHDLLVAGVERMAVRTDFNLQMLFG